MRKILPLLALAGLALGPARAQTTATVRSAYLDFGVNDGTNGNSTPSPDANGNYWNNVLNQTGVNDTFRLVDKAGVATGIKLKVGANFLTNGIQTGGLTAPSAALLGQYAIATATQDYFFVQGTGATSLGVLTMKGFDRTKRYVFHVFGSRQSTAETRTSQYKFTGAGTSTITQTTTGTGVGAGGYPGNNNLITDSDTVTADASGTILLELSKVAGQYAYLNLMRVDIVPGRATTTPPVYYTFQNPGFELGNLTYWTPVGAAPAGATVGQSPRHNGSYAARLAGTALLGLEQKISYQAAPGVSTYRLSGWFEHTTADALRGAQAAHLELFYYDAANVLLGRFKSDSLTAATTRDTWVRLSAVGAVPAGTAFVKAAAVWRNGGAAAAGSVYFDDLALEPYVAVNVNKLTYIGSSVPYGVGATGNQGYTYLYTQLLAARNAAGLGGPWVTANVSVPGNNTVDVTNRFDADIFPQNGKYVFIGLGLGNEGILTGGQPIFNQYRDNMVALLKHARANGLVPVVGNNYGRNDYAGTQYDFVRQMNALMHGWNVPSVNLLGAVDDGNGRYAPGYWYDALHPNDRGHAEMLHAIVPSLLDALAAGKALPTRKPSASTTGTTLVKTTGQPTTILRFVPEDVVHPFTQALRFRTSAAGQLVEIRDSAGLAAGTLRVAASGKVVYTSAKGKVITGTVPVANNRWHKLVLSHYYARGATFLYVDSVQEGSVAERLRPTRFDLGGAAAPVRVQLRDWLFYRAAMNQDEVQAMAADSLLKSSLELYAPLDGRRVAAPDSLANLGQSLNTVSKVAGPVALAATPGAQAADVSLYPNPATDEVRLLAPLSLEGTEVTVYDVVGHRVLQAPVRNGRLSVAALPAGVYSLLFTVNGEAIHRRLVRAEK